MSGTGARRGFNFQDACTVGYILDAVEHPDWLEIQIEGSGDIEDVNISGPNRQPLIRSQIKQKKDNDLWGPAELRKTLQAFAHYHDPPSTTYQFVYNGREGDDFVAVRRILEKLRYEGVASLTVQQTQDLETRFGSDVLSFFRRVGSHFELIKLGDRKSVRNDNVLKIVDLLVSRGRTSVTAKVARDIHDNVLLEVIERTDDENPYQRLLTRTEIFKLLSITDTPTHAFPLSTYCEWIYRRTQHLPKAVPLYVQQIAATPTTLQSFVSSPIQYSPTPDSEAAARSGETTATLRFVEAVKENPISVFVGDSGSGKTMSLWSLALKECALPEAGSFENPAQDVAASELKRVPIYLDLAGYENGSVLDLVRDALRAAGHSLDEEDARVLAKQGGFLLLCDNFDLARSNRMGHLIRLTTEWIAAYPKCMLIVTTSRPSDGPRLGLPTFRFLPLEDESSEQILHQVTVDIPLGLKELRAGLPQESHHLLNSPLTLRMLAEAFVYANGHLPRSRSLLYQAAVDRFLELSELKGFAVFDKTDKILLLALLAKWTQDNDVYRLSSLELANLLHEWTTANENAYRVSHLARVDMLQLRAELQQSGLFRATEDGCIEFIHRTFAAYLAALSIIPAQLPTLILRWNWEISLLFWASMHPTGTTDPLVELLISDPVRLGTVMRERATQRHQQHQVDAAAWFSEFAESFNQLVEEFEVLCDRRWGVSVPTPPLQALVAPQPVAEGYALAWQSRLGQNTEAVLWLAHGTLITGVVRARAHMPVIVWLFPRWMIELYHPAEAAYMWVLRALLDMLLLVNWTRGPQIHWSDNVERPHQIVSTLMERYSYYREFVEGLPEGVKDRLPFYARGGFDLVADVREGNGEHSGVTYAFLPNGTADMRVYQSLVGNGDQDDTAPRLVEGDDGRWTAHVEEQIHPVTHMQSETLDSVLRTRVTHQAQKMLRADLEKILPGFPPTPGDLYG